MKRVWGRRIRIGFTILVGSLAVLVICGVIYEKIAERRDRARYPRIGQAVDIGGRSLNLFCSGEGSPVVILDSGGHTAGYSWINVQPDIAKFTRACWYDRAGYGWSDPGPSPRTFTAIARDLHALLQNAKIPPPYVLVGATAGAFHVRVYNGLYSNEVVGAVLVHGSDPDYFAHEPRFMKGALDSWPGWFKTVSCRVFAPAMVRVGVVRLLGNPGAGRPFGLAWFNGNRRQELLFLSNNPATVSTEGEGCTLEESMSEVREAGNLDSKPLRVLVGSRPFQSPRPEFLGATQELNRYWFDELQPRLASLSTRGKLVASEHAEEPDSIVSAVHEVVSEVRVQSH
jgi:hypothetical protein